MLNRSISKWEMVLLFINGVIGAGIFGLPSKVFKEIGVYSIKPGQDTTRLIHIPHWDFDWQDFYKFKYNF